MPLTLEISCGRTEEQLKQHTSLGDSVKGPVGDEQGRVSMRLSKPHEVCVFMKACLPPNDRPSSAAEALPVLAEHFACWTTRLQRMLAQPQTVPYGEQMKRLAEQIGEPFQLRTFSGSRTNE